MAPRQHQRAEQDADRHAPGGANPVVVERQFQEIGNRDEQCHYADAIEPFPGDHAFQVERRGFLIP